MYCNYRKTYFLISTDFKKTEQKLGKLSNYTKIIGNQIFSIENELLSLINNNNYLYENYEISSEDIINQIKFFSHSNISNIITKMYEKYICVLRENERIMKRLYQSKQEDFNILSLDIGEKYKDKILSDSEFKSIIIKHKFIYKPYVHILYFVLKYDIVNKNIYFDIFVSNTQFIKSSSIKQKSFIPKMFDNIRNEEIDKYAENIYESAKEILLNEKLIIETIEKINNYIYCESKEHIEINDQIILKLQRNFIEYINEETPTNDNKTKILLSMPDELNTKYKDIYRKVIQKTKKIVEDRKILSQKSYSVISTSVNLLKDNIIYEKEGEEDKHSESILVAKNYKNQINMHGFKSDDIIFVIRIYQNGNIGSGLPCNRCVRVLHGNGINKVIYSIDKNNYKIIDMNNISYTYTTTGNKLLNIDLYLYDDFIVRKRQRED
jgi:hypothetical protein